MFINYKISIHIIILRDIVVIDISTILSNYLSSFFVSNFSDFNLSSPVFDAVLEFLALILLLYKFAWIWHVGNLNLHLSLEPIVGINFFNIFLSLFDSLLGFLHLFLFDFHFNRDVTLFSLSVVKFFLETVECLNGVTGVNL